MGSLKRYEHTATRLENRGDAPPSREYVDRLVEGLDAAGVEASWHSAVDCVGRPLFPSKVFPNCHPQASFEAFSYLLDRLHNGGRPVISWYPLNMARSVIEAHPDWQTRFLRWDEVMPNPEWEVNYACFNSPYGQLLPKFLAEIVCDVGFDGIWLDGSTWSNHNTGPMYQPGCCCTSCRERFGRDTGLELPEKVDFSNRSFRRFLTWRYDVLMDIYRRCVDAVTAVKPDSVVCFNNYRRRSSGKFTWNTAIPLRPLELDALMSGELDGFPGQADIQIKINRAYECKRGAETWWPLCDHWNVWVPDAEPLTAVQAALGCVAAGGGCCTGTGMSADMMVEPLRAMEQAVAPRLPFAGGDTVEYAAILASQQTMDFLGQNDPERIWDDIHGANELLGHAHLQTSVIFDAHLTVARLQRYPVVVLGEAVCISKAQSEALCSYAESGGVVLACGRTGEWNEWGDPHPSPILDELFGILCREPGTGRPTLRLHDPALRENCGPYVTVAAPYVNTEVVADSRILADILVIPADLDGDPEAVPSRKRIPGVWTRPVGRGAVAYVAPSLFTTYLRKPTTRMMQLVKSILTSLAPPVVTVDAPKAVRVNTRAQGDGSWTIHLHNSPGTVYRYPAPSSDNYLHAPGEVVPVHDLYIHVRGRRVRRAWLAVSGDELAVRGQTIRVPPLELYEVVVAEIAG